jgi:translation initiation factor IF-2
LKEIAGSILSSEKEAERVTGKAKVIALFKSSRKGIILGCEVLEGRLAIHKHFRVVSAMGPVYTGKVESLHIEKDAVNEAKVGQQAGLKISNFNKANIGDWVECFERTPSKVKEAWQPRLGVHRLFS